MLDLESGPAQANFTKINHPANGICAIGGSRIRERQRREAEVKAARRQTEVHLPSARYRGVSKLRIYAMLR